MRTRWNGRALPTWMRRTATVLAIVMGLHGMAPSSFARLIQSEPLATDAARAADLATIQQMLEMKVVQHRLAELGFTPGEIELRLELASDAELHQLAVESENLMAGGSVGLVVTVLVVILLVLLILRITSTDTVQNPDLMVA